MFKGSGEDRKSTQDPIDWTKKSNKYKIFGIPPKPLDLLLEVNGPAKMLKTANAVGHFIFAMFIEDVRKEFYDIVSSKKVLILANADVDSICASKILQHLLHSDCTTYSLVPVHGHDSLEKVFSEHGSMYKHIVMINCGGTIDLIETLQPEDDVEFFVADSHLPTDVNNVFNTGQVKLLLKQRPTDNIPEFDDIFQNDESEEEQDEGNESGDDIFADEDDRPRKKSRFDETAIIRRRERRLWEDKRNKILDDYAQSTYYGESVAFMMFELAWKLSKDSNELLWWSIVGITEQSLMRKIDTSTFTLAVGKLQNHVSRLSKHGERANSVAKNCRKIFFEKDLSLALYRHWTLSESIYHTRYTACKFKIWTLKGQKRFAEFLADLGLPLSQCKQKYSSMCAEIRSDLRSSFDSKKAKYDLSDVIDGTFHTNYGWKSRYSATDVFYACLARLESVDKDKTEMDRFHDALDCLSTAKTELLEDGIESAKALLVATYRQVQTLLDMSQVLVAGPFLYAVLMEGGPEAQYFSQPHNLTLLAHFVLSAYVATSRSKKANSLPLVLSAPYRTEEELCLVVGIPPASQESPKNLFGKAFAAAAIRSKSRISFDFFDTSIAILKTDDRSKFFDSLISVFS